MRPEDQCPYGKSGHDRSVSRFDLFYYKRAGERFYLRRATLAAVPVMGLTLLSIAGMVFLIFSNSGRARPMTDVNVRGADTPRATIGEKGSGARPGPHPGADITVKPVSAPSNQ